jgi:hypothetical protein
MMLSVVVEWSKRCRIINLTGGEAHMGKLAQETSPAQASRP